MKLGSIGVGLDGESGSTKARGGDGERSRCTGMLSGRLKVGLYVVAAIAVSSEVRWECGDGSDVAPAPSAKDGVPLFVVLDILFLGGLGLGGGV